MSTSRFSICHGWCKPHQPQHNPTYGCLSKPPGGISCQSILNTICIRLAFHDPWWYEHYLSLHLFSLIVCFSSKITCVKWPAQWLKSDFPYLWRKFSLYQSSTTWAADFFFSWIEMSYNLKTVKNGENPRKAQLTKSARPLGFTLSLIELA